MMGSHEDTKARRGKDEQISSWFSVLPANWDTVRVKHGFNVIGSGTTPPSNQEEYYGGEIPWVNTSELRENIVSSTEKTITSLALDDFSALKTYPKGAVLIAMYGATIGRVGILGIDATVNQAVCVLSEPDKFTERFVYYCLQASRHALIAIATGGGQPNLNAEKIREHKLPCPDLPAQRLIADYLDRETARIDALVAEKETMLALLEEKRAALISRAVTRGLDPNAPLKPSGLEWLGDIPAHWEIRRLKFVSDSLDQGSSPVAANSPAAPDELGILKLSAVNKGRFRRDENKALRESDDQEHVLSLRKGDVLITRGNTPGLVADVACVPSDEPNLLLPDLIYRLRVREDQVLPEFLTYFLTTGVARVQIQRDARGSSGSMVKVSQGHVLDWQAPIPPIVEQNEIVGKIQASEIKSVSLLNNLFGSISLLNERRAALITAAVTGQIPVEEMRS